MIKNESHILKRCIESIKQLIDHFIFVDTGSTDSTLEVINEILKTLPGEVHRIEWKNFGESRTEALKLCKNKCDYIAIVDADDIWEITKKPALNGDAVQVLVRTGRETFWQTRLFKSNLEWRYIGKIHAYPDTTGRTISKQNETIKIRSTQDGASWKNQHKFIKQAIELEMDWIETDNPRSLFYAAMAYKDAKEFQRSKDLFEKRIKAGGWIDEIWYSAYMIGNIYEQENNPTNAIKWYLNAINIDESRAENLTGLCRCYRKCKMYRLGHLFGKEALKMKMPDKLFIMESQYKADLWDEYSICAYFVGDYNNAAAYMRKVLKENITPEARERIQKNLKFAEEKLDENRRANHGKERSAHNRTMPKKRS